MPYRTDVAKVQKLIERDAEGWVGCDASDWDTCLKTANLLVTRLCTSSGYEDDQLELIETWLTAHFVACIDPSVGRLTVTQVASIREQYSFKVGEGLKYTVYGQQALVLDTANNLLRKGRKIGVQHLGYPATTTLGDYPQPTGSGQEVP